jgi:hypothetical protein
MIIGRVVLAVFGATLVWIIVSSAVRTVVVPRGEVVLLTRLVFRGVRAFFLPFAREARTYTARDRAMARYAPTALMVLVLVWAAGVIVGFSLIFLSINRAGWDDVVLSGTSITTLGSETIDGTGAELLTVLEALIGLGLVALLISFLPSLYGLFSRREATVAKLYARATGADGVIAPVALLERAHAVGGLEQLTELWVEWEQWFVEVGESHTSFAALAFFRSPAPDRSWIAAAGVALDSASLYLSTINIGRNPRASYMIRSGYVALRGIADFFSIPYDPDPAPDDPISVTKDEFLAVYERLATSGVPVRSNRERAWRDYQGWRVNYDAVLTRLADLTMASYAPWVSDRSIRWRNPPLRARRARTAEPH